MLAETHRLTKAQFMPEPVEQKGATPAETGEKAAATPTVESVPKERFDEVYGQMKELERTVKDLQTKSDRGETTPEQEKELQAKTYLKNLLKETLTEKEREEQEAKAKEEREFRTEVEEVISKNPGTKRDDFMAFLEKEGDDYASVASAMKAFKRLGEISTKAKEEAKEELKKKPSMPSNDGGSGGTWTPENDKGKTMWQIAAEAVKGIKK